MLRKLLISLFALIPVVLSLENGLGRTPAMGWNSWNKFYCGINETLIKATADTLVSSGLADAGYVYLNLDDCWQNSRDPETWEIQPDPKDFPSGMKALGEYIHKKGLKYGLYSSAGTRTCAGRPASLFFEDVDARTYAKWEVDYLKYDNCWGMDLPPKWRQERMRDALLKVDRPIYFSLCEIGIDNPWEWGAEVGNSWRTTDDIHDYWESMIGNFELQANYSNASAPGGWNDPDMLEVGNGNMTLTEYQTHFALWCIVKSPLLIGCDITTMKPEIHAILTNKELIAVNQDPLGKPALRKSLDGPKEIWGGPLKDGYVICFLNTGVERTTISADLSLFDLKGVHHARDLITKQDIGVLKGKISFSVESHGVVVLKLTPKRETEIEFLGGLDQI